MSTFYEQMQVSTTEEMATNNSSSVIMKMCSNQTTKIYGSKSDCTCDDDCAITVATAVVGTMVAMSVLIIITVVLILICCRKRQTALINLTKHHKESDENSYTSSKHSHKSDSKSPDPEYDVININPSTDKLEAHFVESKSDTSCQVYSLVQSNVLKHEEDWDCGPIYSSVETNAGSPHKIEDFNVNSAMFTDIESHIEINADDIITTSNNNSNSQTCQSIDADTVDNSVKPHIYAEVDVKKKKANKDHDNEISKEFVVKGDQDSDEGSTPPPVPPQTTEMLSYIAIQSDIEKVN